MAKRSKKKRRSTFQAVLVFVALCLVAFSLAVRWSDIGRDHAEGEADFQIEVLNGTGETGVAMETAMELRRMGIDVLIVGDAQHYDYRESFLIDRKGNARLMKKLKKMLGCRRVIQQIQENPLVDATLVIGKDRHSLRISGES